MFSAILINIILHDYIRTSFKNFLYLFAFVYAFLIMTLERMKQRRVVTNNYSLLIAQFVGLKTVLYLYLLYIFNCKNVNQSRYRPGVAQRVPGS